MALTPEQRKQNSEDSAKLQVLITSQWRDFSKTEAYKQFLEYIDLQDYLAITGAKGPINTFDDISGGQLSFDPVNASGLLQRSVGYDIVKLYVDGYVNVTTL